MPTIRNQNDAIEMGNSNAFREWLHVLARPAIFRSLTRSPSSAHLLHLLDAYVPYATSRARDVEPRTLELAERMRECLRVWSPSDLPAEIVETARALLDTDGCYTVVDWEKGPELDPGEKVDDLVVWPPWEPMPTKDPR